MTEPFPVSGNIEPASFPHLLVDLHRHSATGSLKVTGPVHPKALYFRGGRILFGSSNDPRDQLGSILIESGKITAQQLEEVNAKVGPGNPLAKVLSESGFVNQRELGDAARTKVERIVADVLSWDSGSFEFEDGVLPKGAVDLKLSTEKLLLAAVQRIPDRAFALRHVGLQTVLESVPEGEPSLAEIRTEVWPLLEKLDGNRTLKDAIALTRLDEFEAAKTACALLFLGIVRAKAEDEGELDLAKEARSAFGPVESEAPAAAPPTFVPPAFVPPAFEPPRAQPASAPSFVEAETELPVFVPGPDSSSPRLPPTRIAPTAVGDDSGTSFGAAPVAQAEPDPQAEEEEIPVIVSEPAPQLPPEAPTFILQRPRFQPAPTQPAAPMESTEPDIPFTIGTEPPSSLSAEPAPAPEPPVSFRPEPPASAEPRPSPGPVLDFRDLAAKAAPAASVPEIAVPKPAPSRPTHADLAALDALLRPAAGTRGSRPAEKPLERWQPAPRPSAAPPPRRGPARVAPTPSPRRWPLLLGAVASIAVATLAAWYFLLRSPAPPTTIALAASPAAPRPVRPAASAAPVKAPAAAVQTPAAAVTPAATSPTMAGPAASAAATPTPLRGVGLAAPRTVDPPAAAASPAADDGHALLGRGALPDAARAFAASLGAGARNRYSLQLLTACSPETVQKAVGNSAGGELFILPVTVQGRGCYRVCWGLYDTRQAAEAAYAAVPAYFRQGGARPRLSALGELLP